MVVDRGLRDLSTLLPHPPSAPINICVGVSTSLDRPSDSGRRVDSSFRLNDMRQLFTRNSKTNLDGSTHRVRERPHTKYQSNTDDNPTKGI